MLTLEVPGKTLFDEAQSRFIKQESVTLELEHSLVSVSLWESKWKKPFLSNDPKTNEETLGYVQAMCLTPDIPQEVFERLAHDADAVKKINDYIEDKHTATWFSEMPGAPKSREIITNEIIYNWMVTMQIPFEAQYWHLNRLITLIKVINAKNAPKKKVPARTAAEQQRAMNEARRAASGSSG